jgi:hypothetical protein
VIAESRTALHSTVGDGRLIAVVVSTFCLTVTMKMKSAVGPTGPFGILSFIEGSISRLVR